MSFCSLIPFGWIKCRDSIYQKVSILIPPLPKNHAFKNSFQNEVTSFQLYYNPMQPITTLYLEKYLSLCMILLEIKRNL